MGKMQRDKGTARSANSSGCCRSILEPAFDATSIRRATVGLTASRSLDGLSRSSGTNPGFSQFGEQAIEQCSGTNRLPALAYRASRQKWRVRVPLGPTINRVIAPVPFDGFGFWDIWAEVDLGTFALIVREGMSSDA